MLRSFYDETHARVASVLSALVSSPGVAADDPAVTSDALERMGRTRLDYVDCYLAARAASVDDVVASFDRDFRNDDVRRWTPP